MSLTTRQSQLLSAIHSGSPEEDDELIDLDQLLEKLHSQFDWETTKQSLQFVIRTLRKKGYVCKEGTELRRGRRRVLFKPTRLGERYVSAVTAQNSQPNFSGSAFSDQLSA